MLEGEAADVPDYGDAGDLSLHLSGHQLEEDVGRGVELLHGNRVRVPPPCWRVRDVTKLLNRTELTRNVGPSPEGGTATVKEFVLTH